MSEDSTLGANHEGTLPSTGEAVHLPSLEEVASLCTKPVRPPESLRLEMEEKGLSFLGDDHPLWDSISIRRILGNAVQMTQFPLHNESGPRNVVGRIRGAGWTPQQYINDIRTHLGDQECRVEEDGTISVVVAPHNLPHFSPNDPAWAMSRDVRLYVKVDTRFCSATDYYLNYSWGCGLLKMVGLLLQDFAVILGDGLYYIKKKVRVGEYSYEPEVEVSIMQAIQAAGVLVYQNYSVSPAHLHLRFLRSQYEAILRSQTCTLQKLGISPDGEVLRNSNSAAMLEHPFTAGLLGYISDMQRAGGFLWSSFTRDLQRHSRELARVKDLSGLLSRAHAGSAIGVAHSVAKADLDAQQKAVVAMVEAALLSDGMEAGRALQLAGELTGPGGSIKAHQVLGLREASVKGLVKKALDEYLLKEGAARQEVDKPRAKKRTKTTRVD